MTARHESAACKRAVNLTLNEDLVSEAKGMTDNLSGLVESLLAEYVAREQRDRLAREKAVDATVSLWNAFNDVTGSIADEYSSL